MISTGHRTTKDRKFFVSAPCFLVILMDYVYILEGSGRVYWLLVEFAALRCVFVLFVGIESYYLKDRTSIVSFLSPVPVMVLLIAFR